MSDVGDTETLTLAVTPHDGTTTAAVQVTSPSGTVTSPATVTGDGGATWTAQLPLTQAGAWQVVWTVTGQGSGVQADTVYAIGPPAGKRYATLSDLVAYLGVEPPDGADRLLIAATRLVDTMLVGAVYPVDDAGLPTDPDAAAAMRDATCAQVAWFDETGDSIGAAERYQSLSVGNVALSRGYTSLGSITGDGQRYAPDAIQILRQAGLLPVHAYVYG